MAKFYITEAIPYVNAKPHIGHALELIQTDTIARFHKIKRDDTFFLWGSDENALKNVQSAEKAKIPVQRFVDQNAKLFEDLADVLNVELGTFQRTSLANHAKASQTLWELCDKAGDIYKKAYKGLYCVGCEEFKTKEDLNEKGECIEHPGKPLEEVEEENYFFRLSKYQQQIIDLIESGKFTIVPSFRKNEVVTFLKSGLQDFSISRSNERAKNWGIPVPGDDSQRIYVWFDALIVYLSGIGFGTDEKLYKKWWPPEVQVVGKGITRFHAIYWIGMLLSGGLPIPKKLFVHEYITVNGQKMSKSIGNVIDPHEVIEKFGADAVRYYCLAKISPFSDSDFSEEKLIETYNADLANGLGNLISRVAKLCENADYTHKTTQSASKHIDTKFESAFSDYNFPNGLKYLWQKISNLDKYINDEKPWVLAKTDKKKLEIVLAECVTQIQQIAFLLQPFLPTTAAAILKQFNEPKITSSRPLFPRI
ncbi:MAG: methionine--tRNA ligase [Candidatus Levyibacteriota bacterium]